MAVLGNVIVTAACACCADVVLLAVYVTVTVHPERSARSFLVNTKVMFVPCAVAMLFITVSGISIAGMKQPATDRVAENVSAFMDDHLSVNVDALAVADAALLTVSVALGRDAASWAVKEAAEDGLATGGDTGAVDDTGAATGVAGGIAGIDVVPMPTATVVLAAAGGGVGVVAVAVTGGVGNVDTAGGVSSGER